MNKSIATIPFVFWALIGVFLALVAFFAIPFSDPVRHKLFILAGFLGLAFLIFGIALVILTYKKKVKGKLKVFLLMTGFSSAGILPSAILHNLVYALFIYLFGEGFWGQNGDEPFFFVFGLVILPIAFLAGAIGSAVILIRKKS